MQNGQQLLDTAGQEVRIEMIVVVIVFVLKGGGHLLGHGNGEDCLCGQSLRGGNEQLGSLKTLGQLTGRKYQLGQLIAS